MGLAALALAGALAGAELPALASLRGHLTAADGTAVPASLAPVLAEASDAELASVAIGLVAWLERSGAQAEVAPALAPLRPRLLERLAQAGGVEALTALLAMGRRSGGEEAAALGATLARTAAAASAGGYSGSALSRLVLAALRLEDWAQAEAVLAAGRAAGGAGAAEVERMAEVVALARGVRQGRGEVRAAVRLYGWFAGAAFDSDPASRTYGQDLAVWSGWLLARGLAADGGAGADGTTRPGPAALVDASAAEPHAGAYWERVIALIIDSERDDDRRQRLIAELAPRVEAAFGRSGLAHRTWLRLADSERIEDRPFDLDRRIACLGAAVAAAPDDATRAAALHELGGAYVAKRDPAAGLAAVERLAASMPDGAPRQSLAGLVTALRQQAAPPAAQVAAGERLVAATRLRGQREHYVQQIAQLQQQGRAVEEVRSLEAIVADLDRELAELAKPQAQP